MTDIITPKVRATHWIGNHVRIINERGAFDFLQAARNHHRIVHVVHFGFGPRGDLGVERNNWRDFCELAAAYGVEVSQ